MRKTIQLSKWLLAAAMLMLTASGCGSRSQKAVEKATALLSRKEQAIQVIDKVKSERQLGLVEYEVQKIVKANETGGWFILKSNRVILCSCKAYLKAGIDLSRFNPMTDVSIDPDETMITLTLPAPTLLSLNMPNDGLRLDFFPEKGSENLIRRTPSGTPACSSSPCSSVWVSPAYKSISKKTKQFRRRWPWILRPRT